jgi:flagellar export protein FliJ
MAFRFSLQSVLRLRESHERLERMRLLAATAAVVQVKEEIEALEKESREAKRRLRENLLAGLSGAEMHFETVCEWLRREHRKVLDVKLREVETKYAKQQTAFRLARQKRRILENLRERRREEYLRQQARLEQQRLDEMFSLQLALKPPDSAASE